MDPLAEKYQGYSSYAYVANNPLKFIDPDGKKIVDAKGNIAAYVNKEGKIQYTKYATADIKTGIKLMSLTKTGLGVVKGMVNAKHNITINIDNTPGPTFLNKFGKSSRVEKEGFELKGGSYKYGNIKW